MITHWPIVYKTRLCIESKTPLSVATGMSETGFDTTLVRDANGLPAIPGTTIIGVLRHLYEREYGQDNAEDLFGYTRSRDDQGQISRVVASWGCVHDSQDRAIEGLHTQLSEDSLLERLHEIHPVNRHQVRLTHRGVAKSKNSAKFNRSMLPAGARFSFELSFYASEGCEQADGEWKHLLSLIKHPLFRLGGNTRRGLGAMELKRAYGKRFDLKNAGQAEAFRALSRDLNHYDGLDLLDVANPDSGPIRCTLKLTAEDFWRIGQGETPLHEDHDADLLPQSEARIFWSEQEPSQQAEIRLQQPLLPASAVKGALAHRLAYHYNRLMGRFARDQADLVENPPAELVDNNPAVIALFGYAKDKKDNNTTEGRAGNVVIDDVYLDVKPTLSQLMHTGIDRFTGGVRDGALFAEEMLWQSDIELQLMFDQKRLALDDTMKQALAATLQDLCDGQLALGAGASKGHGFFSGDCEWSKGDENWLKTTGKEQQQ